MSKVIAPTIRDLTADEAHAFLRTATVGRVAFSLHDRVDIAPVNYVSDGEWIFGRTSNGAKLSKLLHNPWCAVEADEVHGLFEWTSVIVKGTFALLDAKGGSPDTYQRAERLLVALVPGTFSVRDPAPQRSLVFGIFIREISGRSSRP
ncbi:MAG: pyridoxamine 5'-phosphate oxidase family protein [Gemmatimonadota bacterium]|nr:pyridoxamine 5'-phosphate oxidase family protein [Gemmatimonadota bacterium]